MRRGSLFYTVCLVLPMAVTSYMNTLVFLLPLQPGEQIAFLLSIFVSTSVFFGLFSDVMPRGLDSLPAAMKLLVSVMLESLHVLLATLFVTCPVSHQQAEEATQTQGARGSRQELPEDTTDSNPFVGRTVSPSSLESRKNPTKPVFSGGERRACRVAPCGGEAEDVGHFTDDVVPPAAWKQRSGFQVTQQLVERALFVLAVLTNTLFLSLVFYY